MECLTVRINASFMLKLFCTGLEAKFFPRQYGRVIVYIEEGRRTCLQQLMHLTRRLFLASLSVNVFEQLQFYGFSRSYYFFNMCYIYIYMYLFYVSEPM